MKPGAAWKLATTTDKPTVLSRQNLPVIEGTQTVRMKCKRLRD
ncbi:hypothetical protein [Enterococcus casseliflavus]